MRAVERQVDTRGADPTEESGGSLLGRVLADSGKIREEDIEKVVRHARQKKLRFGDAAVDLKLISKDDLQHALAQQFDYPFLTRGEGGYPSELVAAFKPFSRKGQALRNLRARLLQHWDAEERHSLAVVGYNDGEGCSYIAANLAVVFSQLGQRTVIVDADMHNARLHRIFNVRNNVGLSAVLVGRTSVSQVVKRLPLFRDLSIVAAGAPPPNAAELLGRRELGQAVAELKRAFDIVIFDTPPVSSNAGAELVAGACGSSVLVVRQNRTYLEDGEVLVDTLRTAGTSIVGTVISAP